VSRDQVTRRQRTSSAVTRVPDIRATSCPSTTIICSGIAKRPAMTSFLSVTRPSGSIARHLHRRAHRHSTAGVVRCPRRRCRNRIGPANRCYRNTVTVSREVTAARRISLPRSLSEIYGMPMAPSSGCAADSFGASNRRADTRPRPNEKKSGSGYSGKQPLGGTAPRAHVQDRPPT
jgi:hypothetical protein